MTRDRTTEQRISDWLVGEGQYELPDRVLETTFRRAAVMRQVRALPGWRTFLMDRKVISFAAGAAAIAVVVLAGAAYFGQQGNSGIGAIPTPTPTPIPSPSPTPVVSLLKPGMTNWTSETYGFSLPVPDGWSTNPATQKWQAGEPPSDEHAYKDVFCSPGEGDDTVCVFIWEMPTNEGADLGSVEGLKTVADTLSDEIGVSSGEDYTQRAAPMCLNDDGGTCRPAIFVPAAGSQFAFYRDWSSALLGMDEVTVVVVGRADDHPSAARYGGSEAILKFFLGLLGVSPPLPGQVPSD